MHGPSRVYTQEELDTLDLVQHFGADPNDPISLARADGRRELQDVLNGEHVQRRIAEVERTCEHDHRLSAEDEVAILRARGENPVHKRHAETQRRLEKAVQAAWELMERNGGRLMHHDAVHFVLASSLGKDLTKNQLSTAVKARLRKENREDLIFGLTVRSAT